MDRRPLKTRSQNWVKSLSAGIEKTNITPNQISILSIVFGLLAGTALTVSYLSPTLTYIVAIIAIQLRLLCNMLDGIIAVEFKKHSKLGELYNELPDRFSDSFILIGAGYACAHCPYGVELGYLSALLSMLVAYTRALSVTTGAPGLFLGPMAKQHRMAFITFVLFVQVLLAIFSSKLFLIDDMLWLIVIGTVITFYRRVMATARFLKAQ